MVNELTLCCQNISHGNDAILNHTRLVLVFLGIYHLTGFLMIERFGEFLN